MVVFVDLFVSYLCCSFFMYFVRYEFLQLFRPLCSGCISFVSSFFLYLALSLFVYVFVSLGLFF